MQPASYSIPDDIRATLVRLLAYMGALAALAVAAASVFAAPADIVAALGSASAQRPAWSTVERPYPAFELLMPELIASTYTYAIQRRARDGARKDLLSFGEPAEAGPYAMVEIYRPAVASDRFLDASSEIATRIVDYAVTDDVKPDGQIDSKFGPVALVDLNTFYVRLLRLQYVLLGYYDEALFAQAMRTGSVRARKLNFAMPWWMFRNMTDDDLNAMFAYLRTLKPVHHLVDNTEKPTQCKVCGQKHGLGDRN